MRKLHFRTIFSRMLFMQSIASVAVILLIGGTLALVVRVQNIQAVQTALYARSQAIDTALSEEYPIDEVLNNVAAEGGIMIERSDGR